MTRFRCGTTSVQQLPFQNDPGPDFEMYSVNLQRKQRRRRASRRGCSSDCALACKGFGLDGGNVLDDDVSVAYLCQVSMPLLPRIC